MTPEAQRIAIAEALGWTNIERFQISQNKDAPWYVQGIAPKSWRGPDTRPWLPDFLTDLNAMHEAEKVLPKNRLEIYASWLRDRKAAAESPAGLYHWHATAARRAEAFLRAIGRWEDTP